MDDEQELAEIQRKFGHTWFTSKMVGISKDRLQDLERKGYLESGKSLASSCVNFRLIKREN